MRKRELIAKLSELTGYNHASCRKFLQAFVQTIITEIACSGEMCIADIGRFWVKERDSYTLPNNLVPKYGYKQPRPTVFKVEPRKMIRFKPFPKFLRIVRSVQ